MAPTHPLTLNIENGSELPNAAVTSTFIDIYTYSMSVSVPAKTLKIRRYNDSRKFAKPPFVSSSSSNSVKLAYHEICISTLFGFLIYWKPFSICAHAFHIS